MSLNSTAKILVVDDHLQDLIALEAVLEPLGHPVIRATSSRAALQCAFNDEIAFIVLDVMLPEVDGFEVARLLKQQERTRYIPILFLTGLGDGDGLARKGYGSGAVDYLIKPIDPDILRAKARFCLDLHRARKEALIAEQRSSFLARASSVLSESLDYYATLAKIANLAVPTIADWCTITLIEEDKSMRRVAIAHQDPRKQLLTEEYQKRFSPPFDKSPEFTSVVRHRKAVRVAEVTQVQMAAFAQDPAQLSLLRELGVGSFIIAPVSSRESLVGMITLVRSDPASPYQEADLVLAEDLASRAALAIENARLYEAERKRGDFEQQLIGIVSHDLRNPLSVIAMAAAAIERSSSIDDRSKKSAGRIRAATERANHLIRDLLDFTQARRAGGIPIRRSQVDIHLLTKELIEDLTAGHAAGRIEFRQSGDGLGNWDPNRVQQMIENLTQNALKYGSAEAPIRVETQSENGSILISVHNQGDPIPPELLPHLFKPVKGVPGKVDKTNRSIGLGLYIVHQIVLAHGGAIEVTSSQEKGTTFVVRLPKAAPIPQIEPIERRNLPRDAPMN